MPQKKCPPAGAPDWVLTYGDMMSLLLCFFILLAALSELKKDEEYQKIAAEIQIKFGKAAGGGKPLMIMDPRSSLIPMLQQMEKKQKEKTRSNVPDPGITGRETQVTAVREGLKFVVGGVITFDPGSADLTDRARGQLAEVARLLRGYTNKVEVRGHAASRELIDGSSFPDLWTLSYARAKAVADYLTRAELGVEPARVRMIANAAYEPLKRRAYSAELQEPNRRVEIMVSESLVEDFTAPSPN